MKLTAREAAGMLNVTETQIYRWVDDEEIPFVMLHHQPRFHRLELLEWATEKELPIDVDLYEDDRDQPFAAALERGGGRVLQHHGQLSPRGIADVAPELPVVSPADRQLLRRILLARDVALFVQRAADGIAIPRAHSPIIISEQPAHVMLWWCDPELTLGATPARAFFLIIAPTIKQHLQLLSRLSLALHDPAFCAALAQKDAFELVVAEAQRWERAIEAGHR